MDINVNSRFSAIPQVQRHRSKFEMNQSHKTSGDFGLLIPMFYEEVLPGDTYSIETNIIARMQPLIAPIMDDMYLDMYFFFVPNRLVWKHWKEFMGENTQSAWYPTTEYNVPHVKFDETHRPTFGSLVDYFGLPIANEDESYLNYSCSQLPFRAYGLIWNEFFRDQNVMDPVLVDTEDSDVVFDGQTTYGGALLPVSKYHDYFTSVLNAPQKGPDVYLPLSDMAPVVTGPEYTSDASSGYGPHMIDQDGNSVGKGWLYSSASGYLKQKEDAEAGTSGTLNSVFFNNMYADLSQTSATTVNALRLALATQQFYETSARGGSRYIESIKAHFGVSSPDARLQRPELLNYSRIDININQVIQQSESTENSPLGTQAAFSLTADSDYSFTKSFTEHGMIIGVMCARYKHSYQQGINKRFSRRTMFDYYFPVFAHLGEQPVLNKEIFVGSDNDINHEVFGYQEAFADYRYHPDHVSGEMRSNHPNSLDVWHLADWYDELPRLSPTWLQEDKSNVDRVLTVSSAVSNQFWCDMFFKVDAVRVMPMFSIPGLPRTL